MPIVWMRAVRDAAPRFGTARLAVLWALGVRMDVKGTGFASHSTLAADAETSVKTAKRATADARSRGYLVQTRRGRRLGNGTAIASEWLLSQPLTPDTLTDLNGSPVTPRETLNGSPVTPSANLKGTEEASQGVTSSPPRAPSTRAPAASSAARIVLEHTDATNEEAGAVVDLVRREKQPRALAPFLRRLANDGELPDWLDRLRAERGHRDRDSAMRAGWLCSRCRNRNRVDAENCRQCGEGRAA